MHHRLISYDFLVVYAMRIILTTKEINFLHEVVDVYLLDIHKEKKDGIIRSRNGKILGLTRCYFL